ncbi:hypothetical protein BO71DRAFT_342917, partial [Aspergillus ellipticus CBS 707.79]
MTEAITTMHEAIRALLPAIFSWKSLALLLAFFNLKNLPFAWHTNLLYNLLLNLRRHPTSPLFPTGAPLPTTPGPTHPTHPVFAPHSLLTRNTPWETDYNFHKSNSTYFSDLDISRTALVTRVYTPGVTLVSAELDKELPAVSKELGRENAGKKIYIALGSTFCSFKREIRPLERFEVVSRVVGWDRKWVFVLSVFVRPEGKGKGGRTVFAAAVSKYVVKKGWLTVSPERVLRAGGLLPDRMEGEGNGDGVMVEQEQEGEGEGEEEEEEEEEEKLKENAQSWSKDQWTWERIEQERLRGLKVVEGYAGLDEKLFAEWE